MKYILNWEYTPKDIITEKIEILGYNFKLNINDGKAQLSYEGQVTDLSELKEKYKKIISKCLLPYQLLKNKFVDLKYCSYYTEDNDEKRNYVLEAELLVEKVIGGEYIRVVIIGSDGKILGDSDVKKKKDRDNFIKQFQLNPAHSDLFESFFISLNHSYNEPSHELVYLYEIYDAVKEFYSNIKDFRISDFLGIEYDDLGNFEKLCSSRKEGRHSFHFGKKKKATDEELSFCRDIVRRIIVSMAIKLK